MVHIHFPDIYVSETYKTSGIENMFIKKQKKNE